MVGAFAEKFGVLRPEPRGRIRMTGRDVVSAGVVSMCRTDVPSSALTTVQQRQAVPTKR